MKLDQCQSLSCDDLVLLDVNNAVKKQYADPLLKTAGQEQAFTACLSQQQSFDGFYLAHMETWEDPNHRERICVEEEGLLAWLHALTLQTIMRLCFVKNERPVVLLFDTSKGNLGTV